MALILKVYVLIVHGFNCCRVKMGKPKVDYSQWIYLQLRKNISEKVHVVEDTKDLCKQRELLTGLKGECRRRFGVCGQISHVEDESFHGLVLSYQDFRLGFSAQGSLKLVCEKTLKNKVYTPVMVSNNEKIIDGINNGF